MNEIEQKFFKTFEIRPRADYGFSAEGKRIESLELYPPEITDRILLDLYVIYSHFPNVVLQVDFEDVEDLKKHLLTTFILEGKSLQTTVQALFKEAE